MGNESGTWVMYGVDWNDPECLHTVDEAIEYINKVGFLPLFKNEIPGFANYRRDGYDFDALYEDGMAPRKHKMINGEKGFDGGITTLMRTSWNTSLRETEKHS